MTSKGQLPPLAPRDLVPEILSLALSRKMAPKKPPPNVYVLVGPLLPLPITKKMVKSVSEAIKEGASDIDVLKSISFEFPYNRVLVKLLYNEPSSDKEGLEFEGCISLFLYLAWLMNGSDVLHDNVSLQLLEVIARVHAHCQHSHLRQIACECFRQMYLLNLKFVYEDGTFAPFLELYENMVMSLTPEFAESYFDIVNRLAAIYVDTTEHAFTSDGTKFLETLTSIMAKLRTKFPRSIIEGILPSTCSAFNELHPQACVLAVLIADVYGIELISPYLPMIPLSVLRLIETGEPKNKLCAVEEGPVVLEERTDMKLSDVIVDYRTMDEGFVVKRNLLFPMRLPLEKLIREDLLAKVTAMMTTFVTNPNLTKTLVAMCSSYFKDSLHKTEYVLDTFAVFLYILREARKKVRFPAPVEIVMHKQLFDMGITLFHQVSDWQVVSSLRSYAMELITTTGMRMIATIFSKFMTAPYLFAEIVYRVVPKNTDVKVNVNDMGGVAQMIFVPMAYYQSFRDVDEKTREAISAARISLFVLLEAVLRKDDAFLQFMENPTFVEYYFALIYEPPVKPIVIQTFKRYLEIGQLYSGVGIGERILRLIVEISQRFDSDDYVLLVHELLSLLIGKMEQDNELGVVFSPIVGPICKNLFLLKVSDVTTAFFQLFCTFLVYTSKFHKMEWNEVSAITAVAQKIWKDDPPESFYFDVVRWAAGTKSATPQEPFNLCQPRALSILFNVFHNSHLLNDIFQFVQSLCNYNEANSRLIHDNEIDSALLGIIEKCRTQECVDLDVIDKTFELYTFISVSASSVSSVQQFISLLCPIEGKFLPMFHLSTLNTLYTLLLNRENQEIMIPFDETAIFQVNGLQSENFANGFTFFFSIFRPAAVSENYLKPFQILDMKKQRISLVVTPNSFVVEIAVPGLPNKRCQAPMKLLSDQWSLVGCSFEPSNRVEGANEWKITMFKNDKVYPEATVHMFDFAEGKIRARIGGVSADEHTTGKHSSFNVIAMFPLLDPEEVRYLCQGGEISESIVGRACFWFSPIAARDSISLKNILLDSPVSCMGGIRSRANMSFADTLVELCGIDMLLPLFAQWRLPYINGEQPEDLHLWTLDIFKTAILVSVDAQKQFFNKDGFTIMAYLIQQNQDEMLTFDLYMFFIEIFQSLTFEKLKQQLFVALLTNEGILKRCQPALRLSVYRHWKQELFPGNMDLAVTVRKFTWILNAAITFVLEFCSTDEEETSENAEIRSILAEIAIMIGQRELRDIDVYDLIVSIVTASSKKLILYLLNILSRIISRKESPLHSLPEAQVYLPSLMLLMHNPDEDVNLAAIQVLIACSNTGLLGNVSPTTVVDAILHQVPAEFVTAPRFSMLMDHTIKGDQYLFPICAWVAMNLGEEFVKKMYTVLLPGPQFVTCPYWCLWSIASLFKAESEVAKQILEFLVKCSIKPANEKHYEWLVAGMKVMGKATETSTHSFCNSALWEYTKCLLDDPPVEEEMAAYFKHLRFFLFYHSHPNCDEMLETVYHESPFVEAHRPRQGRTRRNTRRRTSRHSISSLLLDTNELQNDSVLSIAPQPSLSSIPTTPTRRGRPRIGARRSSIFSVAEAAAIREELEISTPLAPPPSVTFARELDKPIIDLAKDEIIYHFGIRREYDGSWKDMDFAKTAIKIYLKYPYDSLVPTVLAIAAFVLHYDPPLAESVASQLRGNTSPAWADAVAFYDYHAIKTGNPTILSGVSQEERITRHSNFISSFTTKEDKAMCAMSLRYIKHFIKFQSSSRSFAARSEANMTKLESDATNIQAEYMEEIGRFYTDSSRKWNHFLHCVTTDRAPWRQSLPSSYIREVHFKRDFTMCADLMCPKVKLNMRFDNHLVASQIRDNGIGVSADDPHNDPTRESVNETTEKLKKLYMNHGTFSLFELSEEPPAEKSGIESALSISDCIVELPCEIVKKGSTHEATFALMSDVLVLSRSEKKVSVIRLHAIKSIRLRTRFHHRSAIEIFTVDGKSYFINFPNVKADSVLKSFKRVRLAECPFTIQSLDFKPAFEAEKWTEKWQQRKLSNFQYLMHLNLGSGRSFNDFSQYPVFPWILSDYSSETLDLNDPTVFRDLRKPIGAINEERLSEIMEKVDQLREAGMYPYMYSAGYSCPLSVCLFMIRLEPFTSMHIEIQGGKFDHAARLFSSIKEAYRLVSTTHNDYRELIPEFFCMPEFLMNRDHFDLGSVDGNKVNDVELPNWAKTPMEFVYLHRKALESEYVSANLNYWIDLIWGEKQSGEKAAAAHNVFIREIYPDIWDHVDMNDVKARAQAEALLCHVGQIPPPLFDKPHPMRHARKKPCLYPRRKFEILSKEPISDAHIEIGETVKAFYMTEDFKVGIGEYKISSVMSTPVPGLPKKTMKADKSISLTAHGERMISDGSIPNLAKHSATRDGSMSRLAAVFDTMSVSFSGDGFDIVTDKPNELMTAKVDGIHLKIKHNSQIILSASDGPWTLIADRDSSCSLYRSGIFRFSIPLFTSSVKAACVNSAFNLVVCGTHDCSLLFCSLSNGYVMRSVNLTRSPDRILSTRAWGFVCVYSVRFDEGRSRYFICLYTPNGDLIREREIEEAIVTWTTFTTPDGFDYIILGTERMQCYLFEAFYLDIGKPFYNSKAVLAAVHYSPSDNVAVVVTVEGNIEFLPLAFE